MSIKYPKKVPEFILLIILLLFFIIGCTDQDTRIEKDAQNKTQISKTPAAEYANAASGGTFSTNDKVEYLGVKGRIIMGQIENGKVTSEYLQINDESLPVSDSKAPLLVYGSFDHPTYGHMAMVHYPQRSDGVGEYDLYGDDELVATMKFNKDYSRNAYIIAACDPDSQPEFAEQLKSIVIKKYKGCS